MPTTSHYENQITQRLAEMTAKGREEAAEHRPPSGSVHMDQHEAKLQAEAEKWAADEHHLLSLVITEGARSAAELSHKALELEGRIEQALSDDSLASAVDADMADDRQKLVELTEARMRAQVDWRAFRARHGIQVEAEYPESRIWHFAIVAILALIETIVNAFFYENAQGLLGGFVVALAVSVVNLGGSLVLGIGFRNKNLSDLASKAVGWGCLVLFVVLAVYCNAIFAAFRSEYQVLVDPTDPTAVRAAFARATEQAVRIFWLDMDFGDLMSFILFGIGLILSGFAFYKGYTVDDRHPGYGKKDRAIKTARMAEQAKQEAIRDRVKELLHARRRELQALIHEPAQLVSAAGARISEIQQRRSTFHTQQEAIQRDFSLVLRAYREANAAIRATETPAYFGWVPDVRVKLNDETINSVLAELGAVQDTARGLREEHQDALNTKLNGLQQDSSRILNETFAAFVDRVEADAEVQINRQMINLPAAA